MIRQDFGDRAALAGALAEAVAGDLKAGIAARGTGALAVSGGSTPKAFFEALSARADIDWDRVVVTLVDERWVGEESERSNARLVRGALLGGPASAARFVPLHSGGDVPTAERLATTVAALAALPRPFDAVVLGMGNDGHTASFFPGGDRLDEALEGAGPVVAIEAPGAGEPRVTLTLPVLLDTRSLYLHIEGEEKAGTLERARGAGAVEEMPVRAVLRQTRKDVQVFWCP